MKKLYNIFFRVVYKTIYLDAVDVVYSVEQVNATPLCLFPKLTYFYNFYII